MEEEAIFNIDLISIFKKLLKNWVPILIVTVSAAILGIILSFGIPKKYKVVSKVAPELSLRTNSLTSLASMAGINMGMLSNNNDALLPTVYPEIVGSVPFITDLFDMPVADSTLYKYILNGTKKSVLSTVVSLPGKAVGYILNNIRNSNDDETDTLDTYRLTKEQNLVFKYLNRSIQLEVDKKTFLVTLSVTAQSADVATDLSRLVINNLKQYVTRYRTDKAQNTVDFLEVSYNEAKADYFAAQQRYASYCDSHQELFSQKSQVERQRLQNESTLKFQLFSSLAQQLQQARVTVQQEAPVFAEVVPPTTPLRKYSPKRMRIAIVFAFLGLIASSLYFYRKED